MNKNLSVFLLYSFLSTLYIISGLIHNVHAQPPPNDAICTGGTLLSFIKIIDKDTKETEAITEIHIGTGDRKDEDEANGTCKRTIKIPDMENIRKQISAINKTGYIGELYTKTKDNGELTGKLLKKDFDNELFYIMEEKEDEDEDEEEESEEFLTFGESGKKKLTPDNDGFFIIYIKWVPKKNTQYMIEYYLQDSDGTYPSTPKETKTLTGTTDTIATGDQKTFTGWTYTGEVITGTIIAADRPDKGLRLKLYYSINKYTLNFEEYGGTNVTNQTNIPYNTTGTNVTAPTKTGYTFAGWYTDNTLTTVFDFRTPITKNITAYAKWIKNKVVVSGGSGGSRPQDDCPNGDHSPSLYDGTCGNIEQEQEQDETCSNNKCGQETDKQNKKNNPRNVKNINKDIFNPDFEGYQCHTLLDETTIYQGNNVSEKFKVAHQMLYSYKQTKWRGTKDFAPKRKLTREEAARFMVEFAKKNIV